MRAPRGSGFAGGLGGGFAGIEEQNRYDQNLAMQRTEQERKSFTRAKYDPESAERDGAPATRKLKITRENQSTNS